MNIEDADYNIRVAVAIRILYENLKVIDFEDDYDNDMRDQILDKVQALVGFDPMDIHIEYGDDAPAPEQFTQN